MCPTSQFLAGARWWEVESTPDFISILHTDGTSLRELSRENLVSALICWGLRINAFNHALALEAYWTSPTPPISQDPTLVYSTGFGNESWETWKTCTNSDTADCWCLPNRTFSEDSCRKFCDWSPVKLSWISTMVEFVRVTTFRELGGQGLLKCMIVSVEVSGAG